MSSTEPAERPGARFVAIARRLLPWLAAAAILALLIRRVSPETLVEVIARGPHRSFFFYTLLANAAFVVADAWSTQKMLQLAGCRRALGELVLVRGALNLVGLLHVVAVQALLVLYLHRTGETRTRSALLVGVMVLTQVVGLVVLGAPGAFVSELPPLLRLGYPFGLLATVAGLALLPRLGRRLGERFPRLVSLGRLDRRFLLGAILSRLPHLVVLALGPWCALRLWSIEVPLVEGLVLMPTVLLVSALPITPAGFGTTQATMVWLFSPWAAGSEAVAEAAVFGASLTWTSYGWVGQLLIGLVCFLLLPERLRSLALAEPSEVADGDVK